MELISPALAGRFFTTEPPRKPLSLGQALVTGLSDLTPGGSVRSAQDSLVTFSEGVGFAFFFLSALEAEHLSKWLPSFFQSLAYEQQDLFPESCYNLS